jgi:hypothetical protein
MLDQAKLNLTGPDRRPARDGWRAASDLIGGALAIAAWVALWTWMAAAVLGPLSSAVGRGAGLV